MIIQLQRITWLVGQVEGIKQVRACGESDDFCRETIDSWKERLPELVKGYAIWNMDETGVFWQALPYRGFGSKGRQCKGASKG